MVHQGMYFYIYFFFLLVHSSLTIYFLRDQFFNRFSAYVEQQDMLMPLATVYETVLFSAQVRLPRELTKHEIDLRIKDTLHILDLDVIKVLSLSSPLLFSSPII
jgi:hypothetical protein